MKIIDLTHLISPDMPVYPGTEGPVFSPANSYETDGFKETLMQMYTHTGTHMDPPAHLYPSGTTLDGFSIDRFVGSAVVIDCSELTEGQKITMDFIRRQQDQSDAAEFLLFYTGWDQYWGTEKYFSDYPTIDEEVANYIVEKRKKGIGLDVIGLDPIADAQLTLHKIVLKNNSTVIIENLKNLHLLRKEPFTLCALPLNLQNADGSPIRAIALL